jgi:hypothetical protein
MNELLQLSCKQKATLEVHWLKAMTTQQGKAAQRARSTVIRGTSIPASVFTSESSEGGGVDRV